MEKIAVVATMKSKPGKEENLKQALLALVSPSRADAGCIRYELHQDQENDGTFVFLEQWESRAALDAHLARPHLDDFRAKAPGLLDGPLDIRVLNILA